MIPLLDGYKMLLPELISNDDSVMNRMINDKIDGVVSEANVRINNTDWKSLNDTSMANEIDDILTDVTNVQNSMFEKLWSIILFALAPLVAIPLGLWFGYKVVVKVAEFLVRVTRLYPKDNPPLILYWKGRPLKIEKEKKKKREVYKIKTEKKFTKKFEEQVDEEIDKCSCLYHDQKHIRCGDECQCRIMKAD